jgi:hypothetical protein
MTSAPRKCATEQSILAYLKALQISKYHLSRKCGVGNKYEISITFYATNTSCWTHTDDGAEVLTNIEMDIGKMLERLGDMNVALKNINNVDVIREMDRTGYHWSMTVVTKPC